LAEVAKKSLRPEERNGKPFLHPHFFGLYSSLVTIYLHAHLQDFILLKAGTLTRLEQQGEFCSFLM